MHKTLLGLEPGDILLPCRPIRVVATRKCRINCNETLSPLSELGHGSDGGATAEVVDAGHCFFGFLCADARSGAGRGQFLHRQRPRQRQKQNLPIRDE